MNEKMRYKNYEDFFDDIGGDYLRPGQYGIDTPITIEELYQHFASRFANEYEVISV